MEIDPETQVIGGAGIAGGLLGQIQDMRLKSWQRERESVSVNSERAANALASLHAPGAEIAHAKHLDPELSVKDIMARSLTDARTPGRLEINLPRAIAQDVPSVYGLFTDSNVSLVLDNIKHGRTLSLDDAKTAVNYLVDKSGKGSREPMRRALEGYPEGSRTAALVSLFEGDSQTRTSHLSNYLGARGVNLEVPIKSMQAYEYNFSFLNHDSFFNKYNSGRFDWNVKQAHTTLSNLGVDIKVLNPDQENRLFGSSLRNSLAESFAKIKSPYTALASGALAAGSAYLGLKYFKKSS